MNGHLQFWLLLIGFILTFGAKYVGPDGQSIGMRSFGASAPLKDLQREFGFTVERVVEAAKDQLQRAMR